MREGARSMRWAGAPGAEQHALDAAAAGWSLTAAACWAWAAGEQRPHLVQPLPHIPRHHSHTPTHALPHHPR